MNIYELERKYGRYAIKNLSVIMIGVYAFGFILSLTAKNALDFLLLDPYKILHGQVWRIVSWLINPPYDFGIFTLINIYFIYMLGRTLERIWGNFRYNIYVFSGIFFVIVGAFALYGVCAATNSLGTGVSLEYVSATIGYCVSTYYIMLSVIMAFAMTVPDMEVRLYFIIPLKMKYLAYFDMILLAIDFIRVNNLIFRIMMIVSLLNFFIFYFSGKRRSATQQSFRRATGASAYGRKRAFKVYEGNGGARHDDLGHKCVICGITQKDAPKMIFRYCSKCRGSYEYCEDHLYTHTHVE